MLWPLRFSFGQPFNQTPSLHIALAVILWDRYRQFIRPPWARGVLHAWQNTLDHATRHTRTP